MGLFDLFKPKPKVSDETITSDSNAVFLNKDLLDEEYNLVGSKRTIKVTSGMLSALFLAAKQAGWLARRKRTL